MEKQIEVLLCASGFLCVLSLIQEIIIVVSRKAGLICEKVAIRASKGVFIVAIIDTILFNFSVILYLFSGVAK